MSEIPTIDCLVIDDDGDDFFIAEDSLGEITSRTHKATWAQTYEEADQLMESRRFDICLVDYRIGGQTGLDFIRDSIARGNRTPMILLTGLSVEEVDHEASEAGAFDFIEKSAISPQTLERSIRYSIAQAEQLNKLEESTDLLRATLEHTGAGIAAFNRDHEVETCNARLLEMLGIETPETNADAGEADPAVGATIIGILGLFDADASECMESTLSNDRIIETRRNIAPDGRCVIVCTDITDRKVGERELIESREAAIAASAAKSRFIANMSHELKTPLHAIIGFTEVVQQHLKMMNSDDVLLDHTFEVLAGGAHLLDLINNILTISKMDHGDIELQNDWFYLSELFDMSTHSHEKEIADKKLSLHTDLPDTGVSINCDAELIKKAISNLLSNAVKFSSEQSDIGIEGSLGGDGEARITVWDNGIGMSEEEIAECLEPFVQGDSSLARKYEGTGLGLPLVKRFVELHDGRLEIETEKDVGTRVTMVFPIDRVRARETDSASKKGAASVA